MKWTTNHSGELKVKNIKGTQNSMLFTFYVYILDKIRSFCTVLFNLLIKGLSLVHAIHGYFQNNIKGPVLLLPAQTPSAKVQKHKHPVKKLYGTDMFPFVLTYRRFTLH